jgi:hypothetical protein
MSKLLSPLFQSVLNQRIRNKGFLTSFGMTSVTEVIGAATGGLNISARFCSAISVILIVIPNKVRDHNNIEIASKNMRDHMRSIKPGDL